MKLQNLYESGGGAMPSRELLAYLKANGVSEEVRDAITKAMNHSDVDPYAQSYAQAMTRSFEEHNLDGVKTQVLYLLVNLAKWKGEEARESKKILRRWTSK